MVYKLEFPLLFLKIFKVFKVLVLVLRQHLKVIKGVDLRAILMTFPAPKRTHIQ